MGLLISSPARWLAVAAVPLGNTPAQPALPRWRSLAAPGCLEPALDSGRFSPAAKFTAAAAG